MWHVLPLIWILNLLRFEDPVLTSSRILHQQLAILANRNIQQAMFPAIMPWPMTLAPTNEAVRRENRVEKP
jgi:hypothetical protein